MNPITVLTNFAASCNLPNEVYGFPTWYKYLPGETDPADGTTCRLVMDFSRNAANSMVSIGLAIVEIMLLIAGIVAVAYIIYGGYRYVLSQGNPENTKVAKDAVLNAVIGLVIAIMATVIVRYVGGKLGG